MARVRDREHRDQADERLELRNAGRGDSGDDGGRDDRGGEHRRIPAVVGHADWRRRRRDDGSAVGVGHWTISSRISDAGDGGASSIE
jgi:hypothetical protein